MHGWADRKVRNPLSSQTNWNQELWEVNEYQSLPSALKFLPDANTLGYCLGGCMGMEYRSLSPVLDQGVVHHRRSLNKAGIPKGYACFMVNTEREARKLACLSPDNHCGLAQTVSCTCSSNSFHMCGPKYPSLKIEPILSLVIPDMTSWINTNIFWRNPAATQNFHK